MSTKLYNGLILRNASLEQALCRLKGLRDQCVAIGQAYVAHEISTRMIFETDLAQNYCSLEKDEKGGFWGVHEELLKAQMDVLGRGVRAVDWDATLNICLIPYRGDVLTLFYCEGGLGYKELLHAAAFEDFHFQDSSDRPDNVTAVEWQERHDTWLSVLPPGVRPCDIGLTYNVVNWDCLRSALFDQELVALCKPSAEVRRKAVAMHLTELGPGEKIDVEAMGLVQVYRRIVELSKLREPGVTLPE